MTTRAKPARRRQNPYNPDAVAVKAAAILRDHDKAEHDRIIIAVTTSNEKAMKDLLDIQKSNGRTLEAILETARTLDDKVEALGRRMDDFEKRLGLVERKVDQPPMLAERSAS